MGSSMDAGVQIMLGNVEPFHAKLVFSGSGLAIADAGSATGTFVNGEKVEGEQPPAAGDRICLGPPGAKGSAKLLVLLPSVGGGATFADGGRGARAARPRTRRRPSAARRPRSPSASRRPRPSSTSASRTSATRPSRWARRTRSSRRRCRPRSRASRSGQPRRPRRHRPRLDRLPHRRRRRRPRPPHRRPLRRRLAPRRLSPRSPTTTRSFPRSRWSASPRPASSRRCARRRGPPGSPRPGRERESPRRDAGASACPRSPWCRCWAASRDSRSWARSSGSSCCARRRPSSPASRPRPSAWARRSPSADSNFKKDAAANTVFFGPLRAQVTEATATQLKATVPAGPTGPVAVAVQTKDGRSSTVNVTVRIEATATAVSPDVAMAGQVVLVRGEGLVGQTLKRAGGGDRGAVASRPPPRAPGSRFPPCRCPRARPRSSC